MDKKLLTAILVAALVAGTMDALGAIISYLVQGGSRPGVIFKFIASGILGREALQGGYEMVVIGVLLHFLIALSFTAFYFIVFPRIKWMSTQPALAGIAYGILVWIIMNIVVLPLSRTPETVLTLKKFLIGVSVLILCIGIPIALLSRKYYLYKK